VKVSEMDAVIELRDELIDIDCSIQQLNDNNYTIDINGGGYRGDCRSVRAFMLRQAGKDRVNTLKKLAKYGVTE